ncbi:MAG: tetratricopeptide repeat protein [Planctomycetes bacterium]|nr:tetratricopeptide repeat protein [Planctomycetota bacterium]
MRRITLLTVVVFWAAVGLVPPAPAATPEEEIRFRAEIDEGIALLRSGETGEIQRAIAKFKAANKINPESAEAYYWLALAYSDLPNYRIAANNARQATVYDDKLAEAWSVWGQALLYQWEWAEALQKLEMAQRLAPDDPVILYNLGRLHYHGRQDPSAALPYFRTAWQRGQAERHDTPALATLASNARMYMGLCEYDRGLESGNDLFLNNAINAFVDVLREQPENYELHLRLALAYRKSNRSGECENLLMNIHKVLDQSGADRQLLAEVNLQLADFYLKDPVHRNPMFAVAYFRDFVRQTEESPHRTHPCLDLVRDFLARQDYLTEQEEMGAGPFSRADLPRPSGPGAVR